MELYDYPIDGEQIEFVGIGKIMMNTDAESWNMPHLHFLVYKNEEYFESICLDFGLVSGGETQEEAAERIVIHTENYIEAVMRSGGFKEFEDMAINGALDDYWGIYRHIEFRLARNKRDLSHEIERVILKKITDRLADEELRKALSDRAGEAADKIMEIIAEHDKAAPVKSYTYIPLRNAA